MFQIKYYKNMSLKNSKWKINKINKRNKKYQKSKQNKENKNKKVFQSQINNNSRNKSINRNK